MNLILQYREAESLSYLNKTMKTNDSSLLEVKPQRFSQSERSQFILTSQRSLIARRAA